MKYCVFLRNSEVDIVEMNDYENEENYLGMCLYNRSYFGDDEFFQNKYDDIVKDIAFYAQKVALNGKLSLTENAQKFINSI